MSKAATISRNARRIEVRGACFEAEVGAATVDGNTVKGVVLLGPQSKNTNEAGKRRVYTQAAMEAAVSEGVYEGAQLYVDHALDADGQPTDGVRPVKHQLGVAKNARFEDGKIKADVVVSARERWFIEDCQNPDLAAGMGFSHDAFVDAVESETTEDVTRIEQVLSVDLVSRPATTKGVFESMANRSVTRRKVKTHKLEGLKVREANVGDKVMCDNGYGEQTLGEVMKVAPALLVKVGDRLKTVFDDEVLAVATEPAAEPPAEPAAPPSEEPAPEADEEPPADDEEKKDDEPASEMDDEEPKDDDEEPAMIKQTQERLQKLEVENTRLRLREALSKFPAKATEAAMKRLAGKVLDDEQIQAEVAALDEMADAFAVTEGVDPYLAGPRGDGNEATGAGDAILVMEAFNSFGNSPSARERVAALVKEI